MSKKKMLNFLITSPMKQQQMQMTWCLEVGLKLLKRKTKEKEKFK